MINRRGFFGGLMALFSAGALPVEAEEPRPVISLKDVQRTPYVLVYGEVVVQRGPSVGVCKRCGQIFVNQDEHRNAMLQRAYNDAHAANDVRNSGGGFPQWIGDDGFLASKEESQRMGIKRPEDFLGEESLDKVGATH